MSHTNPQDPPVRSRDPFRQPTEHAPAKKGPQAAASATASHVPPRREQHAAEKEAEKESERAARQQAAKAGSGTTGHEVEAEPNSAMNLTGFDKKPRD